MVYARFSALIPKPVLLEIKRQLVYNNIAMSEQRFAGFLLIYGASLGVGVAANAYLFLGFNPAVAFSLAFVAFTFLVYIILKLKSEAQGKFVESILPDALQLIASNMKSGLTTERALFVAGRPEFGPLQVELKVASKRISSGEKMEDALKGIGEKINSVVLAKTLWLISQGIKSGGQIADLLFQLSDDLKNQNAIQEEINSNISIYILLILFSAVFGAPLLFGVSSFIVQVLSKQIAQTPSLDISDVPASANLNIISGFASGGEPLLGPEFILMFSMIMVVFTTVFSSLTIGVINTGKEINGLRYLLPLLITGFVVFFTIREVLLLFFGNLV